MKAILRFVKARKWELILGTCTLALCTLIFIQAPDAPTTSDWLVLVFASIGVGIAVGIVRFMHRWLKTDLEPKWQLKKMTIFIAFATGIGGVAMGWGGWAASNKASMRLKGWHSTIGTVLSVQTGSQHIGLASVPRYFCSIYYEVGQKPFKATFTLSQKPPRNQMRLFYDVNNPKNAQAEVSLKEMKSSKAFFIAILVYGIVATMLGSTWLFVRLK